MIDGARSNPGFENFFVEVWTRPFFHFSREVKKRDFLALIWTILENGDSYGCFDLKYGISSSIYPLVDSFQSTKILELGIQITQTFRV